MFQGWLERNRFKDVKLEIFKSNSQMRLNHRFGNRLRAGLKELRFKFQVFKNVFLTHKTGGKCEKEKSQF